MFEPALRHRLRDWIARRKLRRCRAVGSDLRAQGRLWVHGGGEIEVGDRVFLDARSAPIELHVRSGGKLEIGDDVYIGGGTSIEVRQAIVIGDRVRIGPFCKLLDNHQHRIGDRLDRPPSQAVVVEAEAELGARVILLPGARVGRRTLVQSRSVITRRVPPDVIMAGVPARQRGRR